MSTVVLRTILKKTTHIQKFDGSIPLNKHQWTLIIKTCLYNYILAQNMTSLTSALTVNRHRVVMFDLFAQTTWTLLGMRLQKNVSNQKTYHCKHDCFNLAHCLIIKLYRH